jgi:predicted ATP-binding protein involved in virulence
MSDGFRSLLSMIFELIRQMVKIYGEGHVFENISRGEMLITVPGVVLIDEVDAHLHPTWQTRIGQWFTKYFPNIQFIVSTHSPLICRASEKGSIWRLATPSGQAKSGKITGVDKNRLIFGNVLDAYGTEVFGADVTISENAIEKKEELVELNKKKMAGVLKPEEENRLVFSRQAREIS